MYESHVTGLQPIPEDLNWPAQLCHCGKAATWYGQDTVSGEVVGYYCGPAHGMSPPDPKPVRNQGVNVT